MKFNTLRAEPDNLHRCHWLILDGLGNDRADVRPWEPLNESIAYAHLFAAAPELFYACIMVLGHLEHGHPMNRKQIADAVAKALHINVAERAR